MMYQRNADEEYQKREEDRRQREIELEEKRRHEDREHDLRMMRMLGE